jgi:hypothetical protein
MTQATLADFMARFPEFSCVDYTKINLALAEAGLFTDAGWGEFETLGSMLYTAHALASQGLGSGAASAALQSHGVKSRASGSHKIEYVDAGNTGFNSTLYGQQFAEVLTRISPGILAVK